MPCQMHVWVCLKHVWNCDNCLDIFKDWSLPQCAGLVWSARCAVDSILWHLDWQPNTAINSHNLFFSLYFKSIRNLFELFSSQWNNLVRIVTCWLTAKHKITLEILFLSYASSTSLHPRQRASEWVSGQTFKVALLRGLRACLIVSGSRWQRDSDTWTITGGGHCNGNASCPDANCNGNCCPNASWCHCKLEGECKCPNADCTQLSKCSFWTRVAPLEGASPPPIISSLFTLSRLKSASLVQSGLSAVPIPLHCNGPLSTTQLVQVFFFHISHLSV